MVTNQSFEKKVLGVSEKMETVRMATRDNFHQLVATDNYIEKYLPFKIQMMVSDTLSSFIDDIDQKLYKDELEQI